MISVRDIVFEFLSKNGFDGLENEELGCDCDKTEMCVHGPYENCGAAHYCENIDRYCLDPRTIEVLNSDNIGHCRKISKEELEHAQNRKG